MTNKLESFSKLFKKVDGIKVFKQYFRARVLFFAIFQIFCQGTSKKSLEIVRNSVDNKVLGRLRKQYRSDVQRIKKEIASIRPSTSHIDRVVWVCWFQGIENAPSIVQTCAKSIKDNVKDREVVFITLENYKQYINFPSEISSKIENGKINGAHLSDLIRLELLTHYGGTWIDATVFLTDSNYPDYYFDAELFVFQKLKPALDGNPMTVSNWFITSRPDHPILMMTKELLYTYWKKYDTVIHYFIFHLFFQIAVESFPEEWDKVVPSSSSTPHILLLRLFDSFNEEMWTSIVSQTSIHKLTYKYDSNISIEGTNLEKILTINEDMND